MPELADEPSEATAAHAQAPATAPATPAATPAVAPAVAPATAPVTAPATAPVTAPATAPTVDHYAAIAAIVPEAQLDALAARVISSGGVAACSFANDDGGATAAHADLGSHASAIQSELQASADKFVTDQGVNDVADFHRYVRAQGSGVLNSTALVLFHSRSPDTALRALVTEYKRTASFRRSRS
jgi:hypothetical protein